MSLPHICSLLPHSGKMVLLDRVIAADEQSLCAEVVIGPQSLFYRKTAIYTGVGAWIGIEYMAQTVAAYAGYLAQSRSESVKIGFLVGTRHYASNKAFFETGSVLRITARCIFQGDNGLGSFECVILEEDSIIARATLNAFMPNDVNHFLQGHQHA